MKKSSRLSVRAEAEKLRKENDELRSALAWAVATIENVLPTMAELDCDGETEEVVEEIARIKGLLR